MRVRDEIKMTIAAYQTLYESSIAYGMRKALMAEQGKNEMNANISDLEKCCADYAADIERFEREIEEIKRKFEEDSEKERKQHEEQVQYLIDTNKTNRIQLEEYL